MNHTGQVACALISAVCRAQTAGKWMLLYLQDVVRTMCHLGWNCDGWIHFD